MPQAACERTRIFAIAHYEASEGVLRPLLPTRCVFASGAQACALFVDHTRQRKTGPCFPIAVVGCSVHPVSRYTLYPPGHIPYGRKQVVATGLSGHVLREAETGKTPWEATVFSAAQDAARGERWPSNSPANDPRRRRTQGRRLDLSARIMGVHPELDEHTRERIATRLGVATMTLRAAARSWSRDWVTRGAAILTALLCIPLSASLPTRVMEAGAAATVWATPNRWTVDQANRGVVAPSTVAKTEPGRQRGPPTTSRESI